MSLTVFFQKQRIFLYFECTVIFFFLIIILNSFSIGLLGSLCFQRTTVLSVYFDLRTKYISSVPSSLPGIQEAPTKHMATCMVNDYVPEWLLFYQHIVLMCVHVC